MSKPTNTGRATGNALPFGLSAPQLDTSALEQLDWVRAMADCPQDPEHHAEGDVWTHTCMVLEVLSTLPEYQALGPEDQLVLRAAALLHDVAKPVCTVEENGRIMSPGHAKTGERIARELLWDVPLAFREQVCALVRLHGLPLWGFEKPDPIRSAILAGRRVRNELTYILAKADALGRRCTTQSELVYRLELYRELCLENDCFTASRPYYNAHSWYRYYWSDDTYPTEQYDNTTFQIIMLCGIAGSGKDTYYKRHFAHLPMVSLDELRLKLKIKPDDRSGQGRVAQAAYEMAKGYCRSKQSFVWNSTNLTSDLRARLIGTLRVYDPYFRIFYLEVSEAQVLERRAADIPRTVLQRMRRQLDMPLAGEGQEVEWVGC